MALFTDDNINSLHLNSEFIETLQEINNVIPVEGLDEINIKILNYLIAFKHNFSSIDRIYYLIKGLKMLSYLPVLSTEKKSLDYVDEKSFNLRLINGFGKDISDYVTSIKYKVKELNNAEEKQKKSELDLDDETTEEEEVEEMQSFSVSKDAKLAFDMSKTVKKSGKYNLIVNAQYTNSALNHSIDANYTIPFTSYSKIKLNHLKMSVTNAQDKGDEKEITVEYPKRSFKNIKATQNSIIKLKVKV